MNTGKGIRDLKLGASALAMAVGLLVISGIAGCPDHTRTTILNLPGNVMSALDGINQRAQQKLALQSQPEASIETQPLPTSAPVTFEFESPTPPLPSDLPASWDVRNSIYGDFTGDGKPEYALLVWRPWTDVPYMEWVEGTSPVAGLQDDKGFSCHIILLDPNPDTPAKDSTVTRSYRLIWAGSALPTPVVQITSDDVDGDKTMELITLEGAYNTGRYNPTGAVSVWKWSGFGFVMLWRNDTAHYTDISQWKNGAGNVTQLIGVPF